MEVAAAGKTHQGTAQSIAEHESVCGENDAGRIGAQSGLGIPQAPITLAAGIYHFQAHQHGYIGQVTGWSEEL